MPSVRPGCIPLRRDPEKDRRATRHRCWMPMYCADAEEAPGRARLASVKSNQHRMPTAREIAEDDLWRLGFPPPPGAAREIAGPGLLGATNQWSPPVSRPSLPISASTRMTRSRRVKSSPRSTRPISNISLPPPSPMIAPRQRKCTKFELERDRTGHRGCHRVGETSIRSPVDGARGVAQQNGWRPAFARCRTDANRRPEIAAGICQVR